MGGRPLTTKYHSFLWVAGVLSRNLRLVAGVVSKPRGACQVLPKLVAW